MAAAAAAACRLSAICRQFQRVIKISSPVSAQLSSQALASYPSCLQRQNDLFRFSRPSQCRLLHTSSSRWGLEEFFDLPENWGETTVKSGAPWTAKQLRAKSNEDLHKLWYVLLKEKNMLFTIEQEAKRQRVQMPSPERIKKVERSMRRLDTVVKEREDALRLLQTGQEKGRPGEWRRNVFGKTFWYRFREHPIPWYMNRRYKRKRFYTPPFVAPYTRLSLEKHLRNKARREAREKRKQQRLSEMFPKNTAKA
ncbi:39S ribosomal protein L47, mitochondrial [Pygocentrus nattereri]|uniref:Large ribosomal subunit protein uL29m n=1 Tax=Pygocentrus nattereri TaxID=42514 RepID=A0AAR2J7J0_PYGNA|nr:39S ribosomal protein L47, mitochondrial [Pygocentrus nattereri]